ncbi:MAG: ABC transporter permease [Hamadaea sp.]|nr:ABC transporter permease [Hamadaea sp.]
MNGLAGTWQLIRLALRRDRVLLPVWILGIGLFPAMISSSFKELYPDQASRQGLVDQMMATPSITALYGPIFSADLGALTNWRSSLLLVIAMLVGGLTVIRHTRAEEEQGRRELLGASVVGRGAALAAAFVVTAIAGLLVGVVIYGTMSAADPEGGIGALAFGMQYASGVWLFAAIGGLAAQLSQGARAARWVVGAVLGGSFLLRVLGDAGGDLNNPLSWISPIGLLQRMRPYADERWWIPVLLAGVAVLVAAAAYTLSVRRDLDAGLIAQRPGRGRAPRSLSSPLALAWRLQRGGIIGWLLGFAVIGLVMGSAAQAATNSFAENPQMIELLQKLGGSAGVADLFLGAVFSIIGIAVAAQGIQSALRARGEETAVRVEPILGASVARVRWLGGYVLLALGGTAVSMAVIGLVAGIGRGSDQILPMLGAGLSVVPAVWLTVGVVIALFGLAPKLLGLAWPLLVAFLLLGQLGPLLQLPQWAMDLSPFTHLPHLPGGDAEPLPLVLLTAVAALLVAAGMAGYRRRDIG